MRKKLDKNLKIRNLLTQKIRAIPINLRLLPVYTDMNSKIGFSAAPKQRNSPILNDLILLILGHLRSTNFDSFRVAQNQFLSSYRYNTES